MQGVQLAVHPKKGDATPFDRVEKMFPDNYRKMLELSIEGDKWIAKPRQWLGTNNFAEIAKIVRDLGGKYVSAGKESHFEGPFE